MLRRLISIVFFALCCHQTAASESLARAVIGIFLASSTDSALCCAYKLALANKIGNEANQDREFVIEKTWF